MFVLLVSILSVSAVYNNDTKLILYLKLNDSSVPQIDYKDNTVSDYNIVSDGIFTSGGALSSFSQKSVGFALFKPESDLCDGNYDSLLIVNDTKFFSDYDSMKDSNMNMTMSYSVWVRPIDEGGAGYYSALVTHDNTYDGQDAFDVYFNDDGTPTLDSYIYGEGGSNDYETSLPDMTNNSYMLTFVMNSSGYFIYQNITQIFSDSVIDNINGRAILSIGNSFLGFNDVYTVECNFKGYISEFSLWNKSLSESEINDLYTNGIVIVASPVIPPIPNVTGYSPSYIKSDLLPIMYNGLGTAGASIVDNIGLIVTVVVLGIIGGVLAMGIGGVRGFRGFRGFR